MQALTDQTKNVTLEQTVIKCISLLTRLSMARIFTKQTPGAMKNAHGSPHQQGEAKIGQQADDSLVLLALDGIHDRLFTLVQTVEKPLKPVIQPQMLIQTADASASVGLTPSLAPHQLFKNEGTAEKQNFDPIENKFVRTSQSNFGNLAINQYMLKDAGISQIGPKNSEDFQRTPIFTNNGSVLPSAHNSFQTGLARQIVTPAPKAHGLGSVNLFAESSQKETTLPNGQAAILFTKHDTSGITTYA